MFSSYKNDLIAGFSVFLLAMPLCLGIAITRHSPPATGILTAILAGGGVKLSIKGPEVGLIVITIGLISFLITVFWQRIKQLSYLPSSIIIFLYVIGNGIKNLLEPHISHESHPLSAQNDIKYILC